MARNAPVTVAVKAAPGRRTEGRLELAGAVMRAALGRSGIAALKREGDGATPLGRFVCREVLYRADRGKRPRTGLPVRAIGAEDGWCEDPRDRNYNRPVRLPYGASTESMKREDHLYDLVVVLGYNDRPRVKGRGSAIFMHLARLGYQPTEGCIALSRRDLERVLALLSPGAEVVVVR